MTLRGKESPFITADQRNGGGGGDVWHKFQHFVLLVK